MSKGKYRITPDFKKEILEDLQNICKNQVVSKQAAYDVAWRIAWELTDTTGAYIGCPYWSKAALEILKPDNEKIFNIKESFYREKKLSDKYKGKVVHEHVVPRKYFIDYILRCYDEKKSPEISQIEKILPCIVTTKENEELNKEFKSKMPSSNTLEEIKNPWERYIACGDISDIYKVNWDDNESIYIEKINFQDFNNEE